MRKKLLIGFCLLSLLCLGVYSRTLFSFFLADDFMILSWLRHAWSHPSDLWGQFTGPWMGIQAVKYYRPMSMLLWFIEYSIWKENSFAFLLVNLLVMFASSCLVMLIAHELISWSAGFQPASNPASDWSFPLCSFGCFALCPLHPETVVWMCNGFVLFETLCSLLSIFFFLRALRGRTGASGSGSTGVPLAFYISIFTFLLALLFKESAIVTPVIITILAILRPGNQSETIDIKKPLSVLNRLRSVAIFWLVFAAYLVVRRMALGELVGGWPANVVMYHNPIKEFLLSLWRIFVPLSSGPSFNVIVGPILWLTFVIPICAFAVARLKETSNGRRLGLALMLWFVCSIIPPYRFFLIDRNLLHSVFAYPSSIPISLFLGLGIASTPKIIPKVALATCFFLFSTVEIWLNSSAWYQAAMEAKQFVQQLRATYERVNADPAAKIVGLPGQSNGANVCLFAMREIARKPFLSRDILNLTYLDGRDTKFPVGLSKTMLLAGKSGIVFYRWQSENHRLCEFLVDNLATDKSDRKVDAHQTANGDYALTGGGLNCFSAGFLKVKLASGAHEVPAPLKLFFCNDAVPTYSSWDTCLSDPALSDPRAGEFVFALRDLPDWTFGGRCKSIKLVGDRKSELRIVELRSLAEENLTPLLKVIPNGLPLEKLTEAVKPPVTVVFDGSRIPNCKKIVCEIRTAVDADSMELRVLKNIVFDTAAGEIAFSADQIQSDAYYIRFRGQASDGRLVGWWSDQICLKL